MAVTSVATVNTLSKEATRILLLRFPAPFSGLGDSSIARQLPDASGLNTAIGCGLRATHFDAIGGSPVIRSVVFQKPLSMRKTASA